MRSILSAVTVCAISCAVLVACGGRGSTGLPPLPDSGTAAAPPPARTTAPPPNALSVPPGPPTQVTRTAPPPVVAGPVSPSNPSPAIVDVNRSRTQPLGPNSPPPSSFENSCAPPPYLFQSKAGYEAVRVKDCRNDQLLYLPSSAQTQINQYVADCQARCGGR